MPQPTPYDRIYDFSDYQTDNPSDPLPGNQVDAELNAVKLTLDETTANLALIQRDDGKLANLSVAPDSLSMEARRLIGGGWSPQGVWQSGTAYAVSDVVAHNDISYVAVSDHTSSGTFTTDLAAGLWIAITDVTDPNTILAEVEAARDAALAAQTGAETAEGNAETAQAAAESARDAAVTAQTGAETAEGNAANSATNAADLAALAGLYAEAPEDAPFEGGQLSALHWAAKASGFSSVAQAAAAGVNLPPIESGDAGKFLRVKTDETGRENVTPDEVRSDIGLSEIGLFLKADPYAVAFTKTGNGTVSIKAGTLVEVDGRIFKFTVAAAVSMPALTAGTDYAIWIKPDGSVEATNDHVLPPVAGARKIGGFHYAPGGNATGLNAGGDTTPQINEFSIWDLKWRPACPDPRGMALVAGKFWVDIYMCGVNHHSDGTSKYNVTIADGSSPPKVPAMFGGNGSNAYSTLNWWEAAEVMTSHGKELLSYEEFAAAMFGTKEAQAGGTDPVSTILRADYTSKWGIMLATGNLYVWSREFSYRQDGSGFAWEAVTGGRGSVYKQGTYGLVAAILGSSWDSGANSGSRASHWHNYPWGSDGSLGARGRSDHLSHV